MTFGIRVLNDFNDISIDDNWLNYSLMMQSSVIVNGGQWALNSGPPLWPQTIINIPTVTSLEPPLLFGKHSGFLVDNNGFNITACTVRGSPGAWTGFSIRCAASTTTTRTLFFRVYAIQPKSEDFGAIVRRGDGEIAFDSGRRPLIVERVIEAPDWSFGPIQQLGAGFAARTFGTPLPSEEYISLTTTAYFDGVSSSPNARILTQLAGPAGTGLLRMVQIYDSGNAGVQPGPNSMGAILPILCDATT